MGVGPETSRVSDLDARIIWYTRLFGRPPDRRVGHEMLWEIDARAWLFSGSVPKHALTGDAKRDEQHRCDHHREAPHDPNQSETSGRCRPLLCPVSGCVRLELELCIADGT